MAGVFNLKRSVLSDDIIVISFGVSPMTTNEIINDNIRVCKKYGNAIASEDMVLCTCIKDNEYSSTQSILRENLKGFSNPWAFRFDELCTSYETAAKKELLISWNHIQLHYILNLEKGYIFQKLIH